MQSTSLEEANEARQWAMNEKNDVLSLLKLANMKHEITKGMLQFVQKESVKLLGKVEKRHKLAKSSFVKGWSEAKLYFFNAGGLLKEPDEDQPLEDAQTEEGTSSGLGSERPPLSSIQLEPPLSVPQLEQSIPLPQNPTFEQCEVDPVREDLIVVTQQQSDASIQTGASDVLLDEVSESAHPDQVGGPLLNQEQKATLSLLFFIFLSLFSSI